jgi:hypothetical protein
MQVRFRNLEITYPLLMVTTLTLTLLLLTLGGSRITAAQETKQTEAGAKTSNPDVVARGKYIVEGVAACADCHTPRDKNGDLDRARWLAGSPVFLQPAQAVPGWAIVAPRLAGLPPGSDTAIITLLTLIYTFEGGLAAVVWTDVVQTFIYIGATASPLASQCLTFT